MICRIYCNYGKKLEIQREDCIIIIIKRYSKLSKHYSEDQQAGIDSNKI